MALLALGVAVLWTWPLAAELTDRLPHDPRFQPATGTDTHIWVWDLWWARRVVEEGQPPFHSADIFYPQGHSLAEHTHVFLWGLLSVPFQWAFGTVGATNITLLLLFTLAATATWLLARELGLGRLGSGACAFAWAFSPWFVQKGLVHFNLGPTPWPPLFLLFLLRWMDAGELRVRLLGALGAGVCLGLSLLTGSLQTVYLFALGLGCFLLAPARDSERTGSRRSGFLTEGGPLIAGLAACVVASPFLVEFGREWFEGAGYGAQAQLHHPRFTDFFTPPGLHPLAPDPLGAAAEVPGSAHPGPRAEHAGLFLGFALPALALVAALRVPRSRRWLLLFAGLFLLAWDPGPDPEGWLSGLYRESGFLALLRVPVRFIAVAQLPLALAAGFGLESLRGRWRSLAPLLLALIAFERWVGPYPSMPWEVPQAVNELRASEVEGSVAFMPFLPGAGVAMSWQTVHEKPVLTSYVARTNPERQAFLIETAPDLARVALAGLMGGEAALSLPDPQAVALDLELLEVAHVLVPDWALQDPERLHALFDAMDGWERAPTTDGVAWWTRLR